MQYGVTHQNPGWDAITGCWLLARYSNLPDHKIEFVNTGNPDPETLEKALFVVDTGKQCDNENMRFDHHHLPGQMANDICATKQVYDFLRGFNLSRLVSFGSELSETDIANIQSDIDVAQKGQHRYMIVRSGDMEIKPHLLGNIIDHLLPLVLLVFAGDTGRKDYGAEFSRELGLHALLSAFKSDWKERNGCFPPDENVLKWGYSILDLMDLRLGNQAKAKAELDEKTVYKSDDGLLWAIKYGEVGSSFAAFEQGARLVVFEGEPAEIGDITTYPIGIQRAGEWQEPNVGELVTLLDEKLSDGSNLQKEISTWFKHNAGFFTGRGTAKAPCGDPVKIDLSILAELIDRVWKR